MAEVAVPRREALQDTIQQRIERYIIDSGSSPGNLLPPQQELARALGISVPSLRDMLRHAGFSEPRFEYYGRFPGFWKNMIAVTRKPA